MDHWRKKTGQEGAALVKVSLDTIPVDCIVVMEKALWINLELDTIPVLKHSFLLVDLKRTARFTSKSEIGYSSRAIQHKSLH